MASRTPGRHGPLATARYRIKRLFTFLYGPADLRDEVDPISLMDKEMGRTHEPAEPVEPNERQKSYSRLPRQHE
ncbi:MAG: hypothetical protein GC157_03310 [Frankiales bacterium]|nr:hypothetical protein [Frankiales bacterium]